MHYEVAWCWPRFLADLTCPLHHHKGVLRIIIEHHEHQFSLQELAAAQGWPISSTWKSLSRSELGGALGNAWPVAVSTKLVEAGWALIMKHDMKSKFPMPPYLRAWAAFSAGRSELELERQMGETLQRGQCLGTQQLSKSYPSSSTQTQQLSTKSPK